MQPVLLYITVPTRTEAEHLARILLEEKHIACANILMHTTSLYIWEGKLEQAEEVVLIAKTTSQARQAAMDRVAALHSYDCPCILAFDAVAAHPPFAQWIFSYIGD